MSAFTPALSSVSHHDASRKTVGITALLVAAGRHFVSSSSSPLIQDPYAGHLAGDLGHAWVEAMKKLSNGETLDLSSMPPEIRKMMESRASWDFSSFMNKIAVRTRIIDDLIKKAILDEGYTQVVIIGAGLDTRPWRLLSAAEVLTHEISWFEVDFEVTKSTSPLAPICKSNISSIIVLHDASLIHNCQ